MEEYLKVEKILTILCEGFIEQTELPVYFAPGFPRESLSVKKN